MAQIALRRRRLWSLLGYGYWAVERREDGAMIGQIGFADFKRDMAPGIEDLPEMGWMFAREASGQGYATEAAAAALAWADATLKRARDRRDHRRRQCRRRSGSPKNAASANARTRSIAARRSCCSGALGRLPSRSAQSKSRATPPRCGTPGASPYAMKIGRLLRMSCGRSAARPAR